MPKLWNDTIESHRREVRDAILDATAALVHKQGLAAVKMSQIAERTGIGRATLYKYFPDVQSILVAWHEGHVTGHLGHLAGLARQPGSPGERLEAVLAAYAFIQHEHHGQELAALLHRGEHMTRAEQQLHRLLRDLLASAAKAGEARDDIAPDELASYCMHALAGAGGLSSKAAVRRLVDVTLAGVRRPR